ncbi:hypothetical protein D3C73_1388450 [compost metagenome]
MIHRPVKFARNLLGHLAGMLVQIIAEHCFIRAFVYDGKNNKQVGGEHANLEVRQCFISPFACRPSYPCILRRVYFAAGMLGDMGVHLFTAYS